MLSLQPINLGDLLLSRLLFADAEGLTAGELRKAVATIAGSELSTSAFKERIGTALDQLSSDGHIQAVNESRYAPSNTGQQHLLSQLGLKTLPAKLQWNTFKNADWIAYALQQPPLSPDARRRLAQADGLRATILRHGFELPTAGYPTLTQARNSLLWQHLCDPEIAKKLQAKLPDLQQQPFSQGAVMGALLNELLQTAKPLPWQKALRQLVAKVAHARRADPHALRVALLQQALTHRTTPVSTQKSDASRVKSAPTLSDTQFADAVLEAAAATQAGRLGESKVFISRVWNTFQQRHPDQDISLERFKQRLVAANQQRRLTLSRADMAYALDPEDVSASETTYSNSSYHFILLD